MILPHAVDLVRTDGTTNQSWVFSVCDAFTSVFSYRQEKVTLKLFSVPIWNRSEIEERKTEKN